MGQVAADSGGGGHKKGGKPKAKKMSMHLDMTPMVDLAFLLLTFFMLTTTFSKPKSMEIIMPEKRKETTQKPPQVNEKDVMNVLLGPNNTIYCYVGMPKDVDAKAEAISYSENSLRKKLFEHRAQDTADAMILIKAHEKSTYDNVVTLFDEMNITKQRKYAMVDLAPKEKDFIDSKTANQ